MIVMKLISRMTTFCLFLMPFSLWWVLPFSSAFKIPFLSRVKKPSVAHAPQPLPSSPSPSTNRDHASPTYARSYTVWTSKLLNDKEQEERQQEELLFKEVYESLHVKPPLQAPPKVWRWCFHVHRASLNPILHLVDPLVVPNSSLAGLILWWKALVGNDRSSLAFDHGWAYDLLPQSSRWIFKWFGGFFPRLNHANIELRTVYLNTAIQRMILLLSSQLDPTTTTKKPKKVRLVVLGAGYDLRGTRLLTEGKGRAATTSTTTTSNCSSSDSDAGTSSSGLVVPVPVVEEVMELDLPDVIQAKQALLTERLQKRRRLRGDATTVALPQFCSADLNDVPATRVLLQKLLLLRGEEEGEKTNDTVEDYYTIFVLEGILVHLKPAAAHELLGILSSLSSSSSCLIFADALPHVTERRLEEARSELLSQGWTLLEYVANPTKTPHMGIAIPAPTSS